MTRNTRTKESVVSVLKGTNTPLLLDEICKMAKEEVGNIDFSTVYRIVKRLEESGSVARVDLRDRGCRYEWAERSHHHHVVCERCGTVKDIDDKVVGFVSESVFQKTGFLVKKHTVEVLGVCPECQKN